MNLKKSFLTLLITLLVPALTLAQITSLGGQTGATQTFVDDTNFTITSNSDVHTLGWAGLLAASRGGTGMDLTGFNSGSILFWDGSNVSEDNALFMDSGTLYLPSFIAAADSDSVVEMDFDGGVSINAFESGSSNNRLYVGGDFIRLDAPNPGTVVIISSRSTYDAALSTATLTNHREFNFPDQDGTFALLDVDQDFTGLNNFMGNAIFSSQATFSGPSNYFISTTDSTVHIGEDGIPGCIVMGDSDSSGVTYITANNGVLSASSSPGANCN